MTTLKDVLHILASNGVFITEKELAELISHDILVGASYYKQLRKRQKVIESIGDYDKETIGYMRIAMNLMGFAINDRTCEAILAILSKLSEKGGKFSVDDAVDIQMQIEKQYEARSNSKHPEH